jgi:hypothetical protein
MRNRRRGCWVAMGLMMLLLVGGVLWVARPAGLELPPRQYPPGNAYPKLVAVAQRVSQQRNASPSIERLVRKLGDPSTEATLTPADHQTLQQAFEPLLQEYRPYLTQPSVVVLEYPPTPITSELAAFRQLARVEAYFARKAFMSRRPAEGVERAIALMQLGWQISHEGSTSHFLTAAAMRFHARTALVEHFRTQPRCGDCSNGRAPKRNAVLNSRKSFRQNTSWGWRSFRWLSRFTRSLGTTVCHHGGGVILLRGSGTLASPYPNTVGECSN